MRSLDQSFLDALTSGILNPILARVHQDDTLDLEIRRNEVQIYYRGGKVLHITEREPGKAYDVSFDENYLRGAKRDDSAPPKVRSTHEAEAWVKVLPRIKDAMDLFSGDVKSRAEREAQQLLVRENNKGKVGEASDYYICDVEYALGSAQFDAVAVRWPSTSRARQGGENLGLALVEVKFGDAALCGDAGLQKHARDAIAIANDRDRLAEIQNDAIACFRQKMDLGLMFHGSRKDTSFGSDRARPSSDYICSFMGKPELIFVLANHDPSSTILMRELNALPRDPSVEIYVAKASFFGYALHIPLLTRLDEFILGIELARE